MSEILDGKIAKEFYIKSLIGKIKKLPFVPCLAIIQIGNRPDSDSFIKSKKTFAKKVGINEIHINLPENISQKEVIDNIYKYNEDSGVQGIIVQLPLPTHLDVDIIINSIDSRKDIDGLTENTYFIPATARGISELCDFYRIDLADKKVTVIGQSRLVGIPISKMCQRRRALVTSCDSKTKDLMEETKKAEIVIVAIGKPNFINEKYLSKDQIIIDVGITRYTDTLKSKLVGDVDFEKVKDIVKKITPVPGGVGQMTVLALFENLIDACYNIVN